jgi:O-acetylhomoserine/O-acetylserine sulfhydrylase-like pyridoxal-dependent enzyme
LNRLSDKRVGVFGVFVRRFGIDTTFVQSAGDIDGWRALYGCCTKLFFGRNRRQSGPGVLNIGVAAMAHEARAAADRSTLTSPWLIKPFDGADLVYHSA